MRRYWEARPEKGRTRTRTNQKFYKSAVYRRARAAYMHEHPQCEVCWHWGVVRQAEILEHLIPINFGGAKLNRENWMSVCRVHADRKSGKEAHLGCLLDWNLDKNDDKIPRDRSQVFELLRSLDDDRGWGKNAKI